MDLKCSFQKNLIRIKSSKINFLPVQITGLGCVVKFSQFLWVEQRIAVRITQIFTDFYHFMGVNPLNLYHSCAISLTKDIILFVSPYTLKFR